MANDAPPKSGDVPPYPEMILAAIEALGDKGGSSKSAISSYIEEKYSDLPSAHASLLTANLASMKEAGKLTFAKNNYLKPDADAPSAAPVKRGRGRPPKVKDPNAPAPVKVSNAPVKDPNTPKRGRGRPPKAKATPGMPRGRGRPPGPSAAKKAKVAKEAAPTPAPASGSAPVKRGRGRPPKAKV